MAATSSYKYVSNPLWEDMAFVFRFQNNNIAKMVRVMQNHCNMKRCNDIMDMPTRRGLSELLEGESEMHCDRLVHRTELNVYSYPKIGMGLAVACAHVKGARR
ncbi:Os09g0314275 [Oryza sativa Japonica Group]|uniref:Os09g0314275 protein n=1 Tax=Oryza sativa subsp. japonica TaxID=39947 RepID=C7J6T7_ORYSJ|nr:Os09g0314275 [Oryza sativa Japonica Group]|eukprot:NP_001175762.1 Os09g0314275 [Oryza sativa Japonica Group]